MLIPALEGGLGNMMFQLGASYSFAKQYGHTFGIHAIPLPPEQHSVMDYKTTILKPWLKYTTPAYDTLVLTEGDPETFRPTLFARYGNDSIIKVRGFFQYASNIEPYKREILDLFDIDTSVSRWYTDIDDSYFLHVRRGDYVGNASHDFNLTQYYIRAIDRIGSGVAYIMSNDIPWCEDWPLLYDVRHRLVRENEVNTLSLMSQCAKGGIAANSSFSWWGLYLNTGRPHLIIPNKWFPNSTIQPDRYRFEGASVVDID